MNLASVSVEFDYQEKDLDAFHTYFLQTAPHNRRQIRKWQVLSFVLSGLALVGGVVWLTVVHSYPGSKKIASIFIAYGVVLGAYTLMFQRSQMLNASLKRTKKLQKKLGFDPKYGKRSITIAGDQFVCEFPGGSVQLGICSMRDPVVTGSHCLFFVDDAMAYAVPRRGIVAGDLDVVIDQFRKVRAAV